MEMAQIHIYIYGSTRYSALKAFEIFESIASDESDSSNDEECSEVPQLLHKSHTT